MFFMKKKASQRHHTIVIKSGSMAKLDSIAQAYNLDKNECITRLIDGFHSNPFTPEGQEVQKVLASGQNALAQNAVQQNQLFQIYNSLPPEVQQALMQKLMGALSGGSQPSTNPF